MTTLKRSQLVAVAEELNEQLGLEPVIDTKPGKKNKYLRDVISEAGQLVDPNEDELEENTWTVLNTLGVAVGAKTGGEAESEKEPKAAEETEQKETSEARKEEEEVQEEPEPELEVTEDKTAKKKSAAKQKKGKKKKSGELSNKAKVYQTWQKNETDVTKLSKIVAGAVKETTIKSWMNQWKNGKNLPAIVKK